MARRTNTNEEKVGQQITHELPASGPVGELTDTIETVDTPRWEEKAKNLAFMNEMVTVQIHDTGSINEEQFVEVRNDGKPQFIERGKPQTIRRMFVEVLARAKKEGISTPEYTDATGARATKIIRSPSLRYPFSVVEDRNPEGRTWLTRILAEAA